MNKISTVMTYEMVLDQSSSMSEAYIWHVTYVTESCSSVKIKPTGIIRPVSRQGLGEEAKLKFIVWDTHTISVGLISIQAALKTKTILSLTGSCFLDRLRPHKARSRARYLIIWNLCPAMMNSLALSLDSSKICFDQPEGIHRLICMVFGHFTRKP